MKRTQIYLDPELNDALKRQATKEGIKISELIRKVLSDKFLNGKGKSGIIDSFAGKWKSKKLDPKKQITALRNTKK